MGGDTKRGLNKRVSDLLTKEISGATRDSLQE
jgi:hypothetical protein